MNRAIVTALGGRRVVKSIEIGDDGVIDIRLGPTYDIDPGRRLPARTGDHVTCACGHAPDEHTRHGGTCLAVLTEGRSWTTFCPCPTYEPEQDQ